MYLNFTPSDFDHPTTKAVRGRIDMQGVLFTKVDDKTTKLTLYTKVDPVLSMIPQTFVEKGSKDSGFLIKNFAEYVAKKK